MEFKPFSKKQMLALSWWCPESPHRGCDAVIADGAVRSGKTLCLGLGFAAWAMACFSDHSFALCGKTIRSLRRNLMTTLLPALREAGFGCLYRPAENCLLLSCGGRSNRFYLFGGRDEGSAALIQGVTLAGVFLDEAALMPQSFVEQALARCSVSGSKFWFNCNPEHPQHWFYREWILQAEEKNALYLHFTMEDNPALTSAVRGRYRRLYSGPFFERFILGRWVAAQGLVYPFMTEELLCNAPAACESYRVSCDYGTVNPCSMGLWGKSGGVWYRLDEYYYDSRARGEPRTDEEHYAGLEELCAGREIELVTVDPSAASFIECIRRHGRYRAVPAQNDVLDGIRRVSVALKQGEIRVCRCCRAAAKEFSLYRWKDGQSRDAPVKENDHAMDDIRYFMGTLRAGGFFAMAAPRGGPTEWPEQL